MTAWVLKQQKRRDKGFIFVVALVVIAALLALMVMMAADERAAGQVTLNQMRTVRAQAAADAGVARAVSLLTAANTNVVTLNDDWAQLGTGGDEEMDLNGISPASTSFRMEIIDASSLINLNMTSVTQLQAQLQLLPIDQQHIDCLLDWLQPGEVARTDGAKDAFYNSLPQPYNAKLAPLTTVNELLLVDNWTAQDLYQTSTTMSASSGSGSTPGALPLAVSAAEPLPVDTDGNQLPLAALFTVDAGCPNTQATTGGARINFDTRNLNRVVLARMGINTATANLIVARAPFTSFRTLLSVPGLSRTVMTNLLNVATFSTATRSTGKLNLNTVTLAALQTVPGLSQATAQSIIQQQTTGFTTLGALASVQGISTGQIAQVADYFCVGSDTWLVRVYGQDEGTSYAEEAVVGFRNSVIKVENLEKINTAGVPEWWNWDLQTTGSEDAGTSQ